MFDEVDNIGGKLTVKDFGTFDVQWEDGTLSIHDVDAEKLRMIVQFLRNGPRMMDLIAKVSAKIRPPAVTDPPQPVASPPTPTLPARAPKTMGKVMPKPTIPESETVSEPAVDTSETKTGRFDASKPNPPNEPTIGLDPAVVQREYERQAEAKKKADAETAKTKAKEAAAAAKKAKAEKAKAMKAAAPPTGMDDMFSFMIPEGGQDVPEIPDEAKAVLDEKLRQVNAAAEALAETEDTGWQIPLVGETYDNEGVNKITMKDNSVTMKLASGTIVECDLHGNELQRIESETPAAEEAEGELGDPLPQELASTAKVSDLVLHFTKLGLDKDAIVAALSELKKSGHPAVTNVDDIAGRVGLML